MFISSYLSVKTENTPYSISGRGQSYSWSSTWWLLSPYCWSYWRLRKEERNSLLLNLCWIIWRALLKMGKTSKKLFQGKFFEKRNLLRKVLSKSYFWKVFHKVNIEKFFERFWAIPRDGIQNNTQTYKRGIVPHSSQFWSPPWVKNFFIVAFREGGGLVYSLFSQRNKYDEFPSSICIFIPLFQQRIHPSALAYPQAPVWGKLGEVRLLIRWQK